MRWAERGLSPIKASLVGLVLLIVGTYFIFTKQLPFTHHNTINAVVRNSNLLGPGSPVRIGGVTVGKVTSTGRYRNTKLATVTMQIDDTSQEIHSDATITIRPRLFLEGNFYVQLAPGTPDAPALGDGGTIPVDHTSDPVQIDQLFDAFPSYIRSELQHTLQGFGTALDTTPSAAQDAHLDPAVRGLTGAQAINKTFNTSVASLRDSGIVSQALVGTRRWPLSKVVSGFANASDGLARADGQLGELITEFRPHHAGHRRPAAGPSSDGQAAGAHGTQCEHRVRGARSGIPGHRELLRRLRDRAHTAAGDDPDGLPVAVTVGAAVL